MYVVSLFDINELNELTEKIMPKQYGLIKTTTNPHNEATLTNAFWCVVDGSLDGKSKLLKLIVGAHDSLADYAAGRPHYAQREVEVILSFDEIAGVRIEGAGDDLDAIYRRAYAKLAADESKPLIFGATPLYES